MYGLSCVGKSDAFNETPKWPARTLGSTRIFALCLVMDSRRGHNEITLRFQSGIECHVHDSGHNLPDICIAIPQHL
jgi:hypothetical protein